MGLGQNVGKLMKARGISYGDVARGIEIQDPQAIWVLVKRDSKKSQFASQLADYFKIPLPRLLADDFDVDEVNEQDQTTDQDFRIKTSKSWIRSDAEKFLVLVRTFLDIDAEGRTQLIKAASSIAKAHAARSGQIRRAKRG
jgi:hypothetical protein